MSISLFPLIFTALLVGAPLAAIAKGRKSFVVAAAVSVSVTSILLLWVYVPGWRLMRKADRGDLEALYELARWTEKHDEQIGKIILWPFSADVLGGYAILEKAAAMDYPPAVYAMGVRLKHGDHVPRPSRWNGPAGNYFPNPARGQVLIDKAIQLGYRPTIAEEYFYWQQYRR